MSVYKPGTTLDTIINDGWSRGFSASQTASEATASGYTITELEVSQRFCDLDDSYLAHCRFNDIEA